MNSGRYLRFRISIRRHALRMGEGQGYIAQAHPGRVYQMGMAEQLLMMTAGALPTRCGISAEAMARQIRGWL